MLQMCQAVTMINKHAGPGHSNGSPDTSNKQTDQVHLLFLQSSLPIVCCVLLSSETKIKFDARRFYYLV